MEWIPVIFVTFKALVLGTGMFFAVKWHYDQGKKRTPKESQAARRAIGQVAAVFVLALLGVALAAFVIVKVVGLNLSS